MDEASLLADFLSHVLTTSLIDRRVYRIKEFNFSAEGSISGKITGTHISGMETEIKTVTHQEVYCRKLKSGIWEAEVIFEI